MVKRKGERFRLPRSLLKGVNIYRVMHERLTKKISNMPFDRAFTHLRAGIPKIKKPKVKDIYIWQNYSEKDIDMRQILN